MEQDKTTPEELQRKDEDNEDDVTLEDLVKASGGLVMINMPSNRGFGDRKSPLSTPLRMG